jgi:hypothetical protein
LLVVEGSFAHREGKVERNRRGTHRWNGDS